MRRRHRDAERGREEQCHRATRLGAEAADRLQLGDLLAHRLDDSPATEQRAQCHRRLACEHDPERNVGAVKLRLQGAVRDEDERNDAHCFLRIVAAVTEAVERRRHDSSPLGRWPTA